MDEHLESQLRAAKVAGRALAMLSWDARAALVLAVADEVDSRIDTMIGANAIAALALVDACYPFVAGKMGDLETEWLSMDCNAVVIPGIDAAIEHIAEYGSHSDGILSDDPDAIARFIQEVDSPAVFVNASTRFHDGGQFCLGAEVAVSTQKVHARGPLGLEALTSCKWIATGDYLVRS